MKIAGTFTNPKSIIIATYVLCGFANIGSIGIQIGGIGGLAPNKRGDISKYSLPSLATALLSATIIGAIMG